MANTEDLRVFHLSCVLAGVMRKFGVEEIELDAEEFTTGYGVLSERDGNLLVTIKSLPASYGRPEAGL